MNKFYGYIQPKTGWLYDHDDRYWVKVGKGETYDQAREDTLKVVRCMNRGDKDPIEYVMSTHYLRR